MALTEFTTKKDADDVAAVVEANGTHVKVVPRGRGWQIIPVQEASPQQVNREGNIGGIGLSSHTRPSTVRRIEHYKRPSRSHKEDMYETISKSSEAKVVSSAVNETTHTIPGTLGNIAHGLGKSLGRIKKSMMTPEQEGRPSIAAMPARRRNIRIASQPNLKAIKDEKFGHTLTGQGF